MHTRDINVQTPSNATMFRTYWSPTITAVRHPLTSGMSAAGSLIWDASSIRTIWKLDLRRIPKLAPVHVVKTIRAAFTLFSAFCMSRGSSLMLPPNRASTVYFCRSLCTLEISVAARRICSSSRMRRRSFSTTNRSSTLSTAV